MTKGAKIVAYGGSILVLLTLALANDRAKPTADAPVSPTAPASAAPKAAETLSPSDSALMRTEVARRESALKSMTKKHDDVEGFTIYSSPLSPRFVNSRTALELVFVTTENTREIAGRMSIYYVGEDWLFIDKFIINADGRRFEIEPTDFGPGSIQRDNGSGEVWEWLGVNADEHLEMLRAIARSKKTTIRFSGRQYHHDWVVSANDIKALQQSLAAWEAKRIEFGLPAGVIDGWPVKSE